MDTVPALILVLTISLAAPVALKPLLSRMGVIDVPNERSSHNRPVMRGLGLAPMLAMAVGYTLFLAGVSSRDDLLTLGVILGVSMALGLLGWVEDTRGLAVRVRAGAQLLTGLIGATAVIFITDSPWWTLPIFTIGIAGYTNVANFMDGINGISGMHGVVVGLTYGALGTILGLPWFAIAGWVLALAFTGFLPWNLVRGGLFLGDVGSYLLGGAIAIIGAAAIANGVPLVAVLGPTVVYLADTGTTLVRRIARGDRWFEAHRGHVYQRLTDLSLSHLQVAGIVSSASVLCALLGGISLLEGILSQMSACIAIMAVAVLYVSAPAFLAKSKSHEEVF